MSDPQDDVPCRDCKRPTQHATEVCDDCRTPAGRLVAALAALGIKAETSDDTDGVIVNGLFVDAVDCGWGISGNGDDLDGNIEAAANAIAAIVQTPALRSERDALAAEVERLRVALEKPVAGAWVHGETGWTRWPASATDVVGRVADNGDWWASSEPGEAQFTSGSGGSVDAGRHAADLALVAAGYRLVGGVHPLPDEVRS